MARMGYGPWQRWRHTIVVWAEGPRRRRPKARVAVGCVGIHTLTWCWGHVAGGRSPARSLEGAIIAVPTTPDEPLVDADLAAEIELLGDLIAAAASAGHSLSEEEVDAALGLGEATPERGEPP
jgi:hypothetical protein